VQCLHRWQKVLNPALVKGPWTPEVRPTRLRAAARAFLAQVPSRTARRRRLRALGAMCAEAMHPGSQAPLRPPAQEDEKIFELVASLGCKSWSKIAKQLPGRIGKQARERCAARRLPPLPLLTRSRAAALSWHNHLNPEIRREDWTLEEDRLLVQASSR